MATAAAAASVAVWEFVRFSGTWIAYPPEACEKFECARTGAETKEETKVFVDIADKDVRAHFVDVVKMEQVFPDGQDDSFASPIRRRLYPLDSAAALGVRWEWGTHGGRWISYSIHLSCLIEDARRQGLEKVNLQDYYPESMYTVDFTDMHQKNNITGFCRAIRRVQGRGYPPSPDPVTNHGVTLSSPESKPKRRKGWRFRRSKTRGVPSAAEGPSGSKSPDADTVDSLEGIKSPNNFGMDCSPQDHPETGAFLSTHTVDVIETIPKEDCSICCEPLPSSSSYGSCGRVVRFWQCCHHFHYACLAAMYESNPRAGYLQCPVCKAIYGVKRGNQPPGSMSYQVVPFALAGYEDCGTIQITYHIFSGIQGPEHPCPGRPYTARGFPRRGYLPNNEQGRRALKLLVDAWDRRLIFTIGQSTTTGEQDTVTWNEIHHKTEFGSNLTGHGYPDPLYLDNLLAELRAQGVTD